MAFAGCSAAWAHREHTPASAGKVIWDPRFVRGVVFSTDVCLGMIVDREDPGWDPTRANSRSGAYGLPQALPGDKMAWAGADWRSNPWTQLRWMRRYVAQRYGGSCQAWAAWQRQGWY